MDDRPKPTGKQPVDIVVSGCLMPWRDGPVLLSMPGSASSYLPLFSGEAKLRECLATAGVQFASIKQITDGAAFLESVPRDVVLIHDPWFTPEGRVRFQQIVRGN